MIFDHQRIRFKNKNYAVLKINNNNTHPVVLDWDDFQKIRQINKNWKIDPNGFVSCIHTYNDKPKEVFLHGVIMALKLREENKTKLKKPIIHINKIISDNRKINLIYDEKNIHKNTKKKIRTVELPEDCGINKDEIPTYVWYMKNDKNHGDRFVINIGDITWKTTSSKKYSLRYKLEEAKLFLRELKEKNPELFEENSMNGDLNSTGKELEKEYYKIISRAGFENKNIKSDNTQKLLKIKLKNKEEKKTLDEQNDITNKKIRRRMLCKLPEDCNIKSSDIPEHCYYRKKTNTRGDYFIIQKQNKIIWQSTSSKKINTDEKFQQMMDYLKN